LFRAGFDEKRVSGALASSLKLAMAGDIERAEAADIQTNVLTAMRMDTSSERATVRSSQRVADVIAYAANRSNTTVSLMGQTFKYVAPMAAAAGLSIEGVAAMSMLMANNGIKGSEAGVAMRSALVRMVKPTKDMLRVLQAANISIKDFVTGGREIRAVDVISGLKASGLDVSGLAKPIQKLLSDSVLRQQPATLAAKLTELIAGAIGDKSAIGRDKIATALQEIITTSGSKVDLLGFFKALREKNVDLGQFARLFDTRQGARLMTLLAGDINGLLAQVQKFSPGYVNRAAEMRMKGIVGEVARLKAAWENLWIRIGDSGVLTAVGRAFDAIGNFLDRVSAYNPAILKFGTYLAMALAAAGPLGLALSGLGSIVAMLGGPVVVGVLALGAAMAYVATQSKALSGLAVVTLGVTAPGLLPIVGALKWLVENRQGLASAGSGFAEGFGEEIGTLKTDAPKVAAALEEIWDTFNKLTGAVSISRETWKSWGKTIGTVIGGAIRSVLNLLVRLDNQVRKAHNLIAGSFVGRYFGAKTVPLRPLIEPSRGTVPSARQAEEESMRRLALLPKKKPDGGSATDPTPAPAPTPGTAPSGATTPDQIKRQATDAVGVVQAAMAQIKSIVASVDLTASGQKIMATLAAGIRAGTPEVVDAMRAGTQRIKNHVPHSPAREGPLMGLRGHGIMTEIAAGIAADTSVVSAMHGAAARARAAMTVQGQAGAGGGIVGAPPGMRGGNSIGAIHVAVNVSGGGDPARIGEEVGRRVRDSIRETFSDGGI
jgi:hypothetical protein